MQREELGGWCMIAGAVLGLVTMAFHPADAGEALRSVAVHSTALFSVPVAFYGGWVLTRRLSAGGPLPELALAFYGVSAVASLTAATTSGLVAPDLIRAAALPEGAVLNGLMRYNFALNQASAKLLIAGSAAAIGIWSVQILRTRLMRRAHGVLGCAVAALELAAVFSGRVRMDVHGFGALVLAQAIWFLLVGAELRRGGAGAGDARVTPPTRPSR